MALSAGALNTRLVAQRRAEGTDDWGSPIQSWQDLGSFQASVRNDTGMGAIRSAASAGIPASIARYSIEVRAEVIRAYGITSADRIIGRLPFSGADTIFSVTGVISDFSDPSHAYILTEVGADER